MNPIPNEMPPELPEIPPHERINLEEAKADPPAPPQRRVQIPPCLMAQFGITPEKPNSK